MELICCCLSQVIKNLFHPITTLRCSNIDQDSQPHTHTHPRPTQRTHPHTHQGKEERRGKEEEGKGDPHYTTPRTTKHPLITRTHTTHHTHATHKGKEEKGKGKGGPFVCGLGTMCGMSVGCKRMRCDAGVMWCSAGEKKSEG